MPVPVVKEHWPEWKAAAGRRSLRTRCPGWRYAATTDEQRPDYLGTGKNDQCGPPTRAYISIEASDIIHLT